MILEALAPGKVNLSLFLGGLRSDGRHQLVTLLESVSLADQLRMSEPAREDQVHCPGVDGENLVASALRGLRDLGWAAPAVRVEIAKRIPVAAGMGGGSADAAAAIRLAVSLSPGRPEEVAALAARLGADVPSQLAPGLVLGVGAGEIVESYPPLAAHALVIVPLPYALSTPDVYREADRLGLPRSDAELASCRERLEAALVARAGLPEALIVNDLAPAAVSLCPSVAAAIDAVREAGADHALVCGSGPTVAGLFWGGDAPRRAATAAGALTGRFAGATAAEPVTAEFGMPRIAQ